MIQYVKYSALVIEASIEHGQRKNKARQRNKKVGKEENKKEVKQAVISFLI